MQPPPSQTGGQPDEQQRSLQDTVGIPNGGPSTSRRQIEARRAKQTAVGEKSKAEAFIRQVVQVKMAAAAMPKDITPAFAQLPPTAPDNLAPETYELPPPESSV
jgi:hypothetical protein